MFTTMAVYERVVKEVDRHFTSEQRALRKLIRLARWSSVQLPRFLTRSRVVGLQATPTPLDYTVYTNAVSEAYKDAIASKPLRVTPESDAMYDAIPPPQLVILDVCLHKYFPPLSPF